MGVFLHKADNKKVPLGLPHARGGVSIECEQPAILAKSSPRTWGCFFNLLLAPVFTKVFPTHVGVFLSEVKKRRLILGLPHARGGVSC